MCVCEKEEIEKLLFRLYLVIFLVFRIRLSNFLNTYQEMCDDMNWPEDDFQVNNYVTYLL